jgi:FkbM family methyltransferase
MTRFVKKILAALGYQVRGTRFVPRQLLEPSSLRTVEFDDVICRWMFDAHEAHLDSEPAQFAFVQIGAFDGITRDPIRKYIERCGWRGVLVEPQARAAAHLRELYRGNDRIVVLQAAVDRNAGRRSLFTVQSDSAPQWAGGMASFDRESIVKHSDLIPGLEEMIQEENVDCITFDDVLGNLRSDRLDLLQIDAEGADGYLLSLFPFGRVLPVIVHWEVKHLSIAQREECLDRLVSFGYRFALSGDEDMLAVRF